MRHHILWIFILAGMLAIAGLEEAFSFDLLGDIRTNTRWTLGEVASAGTSVNLRNGQYNPSEFAQIANYRMLSAWYGGIEIPQGDGTLKLTDSAKMGLNLGYFLDLFTNKPPMLLANMVIGPAISCSLATTPRVVNYWMDFNYRFGSNAAPIQTTPQP